MIDKQMEITLAPLNAPALALAIEQIMLMQDKAVRLENAVSLIEAHDAEVRAEGGTLQDAAGRLGLTADPSWDGNAAYWAGRIVSEADRLAEAKTVPMEDAWKLSIWLTESCGDGVYYDHDKAAAEIERYATSRSAKTVPMEMLWRIAGEGLAANGGRRIDEVKLRGIAARYGYKVEEGSS